jgi:hypothetical protein
VHVVNAEAVATIAYCVPAETLGPGEKKALAKANSAPTSVLAIVALAKTLELGREPLIDLISTSSGTSAGGGHKRSVLTKRST